MSPEQIMNGVYYARGIGELRGALLALLANTALRVERCFESAGAQHSGPNEVAAPSGGRARRIFEQSGRCLGARHRATVVRAVGDLAGIKRTELEAGRGLDEKTEEKGEVG